VKGTTSLNISQTVCDAEQLLMREEQLSEPARVTIQSLIDAVTLLSNRLKTDSSNSSLPPSLDPNRPRHTKQRQSAGGKRKPGAQKGHKGTTLKRVSNPDETEDIHIDRRTVPRGFYQTTGYETRQVFDINITLFVKEYRAEIIEDERGEQYVATFPDGVTQSAQYGDHTKASAVYLSQYQLVPLDRVRDFFEDQASIPISKGSIANFNVEASGKLDTFVEWAKRQLAKSALNHSDETGINIGAKTAWLHNLSNDKVTLFHADEKRGKEAMDRMGVLPLFKGILLHDHWKPYFQYSCSHALCNAHHLRELEWCLDFEDQVWAGLMKALLIEINLQKVNSGFVSHASQERFEQRYRVILAQGQAECPIIDKAEGTRGRTKKSKSRNLLERLQNFENETLRFMREMLVPFTNNQGERDLRMTKVQQKISGCFRSFHGANNFCRIRSYIATCIKNNCNPTDALRLLFEGKLPEFMKSG
jgi:transposase